MMHSSVSHTKRGFTLVELLAVITILGILSSMLMVALAGAAEQARAARTRAQIQKIHELIAYRWESYRTRRVERDNSGTALNRMQDQVDQIRELMRMELPDRISDIKSDPVKLPARPALSSRYQRQVIKYTNASGANFNAQWSDALTKWSQQRQESECLFLILSSIQDGDMKGTEFFRESEIDDVDNDGVPEIVDGWGRPIKFYRWAPGYDPTVSNLNDHYSPDAFDPLGVRSSNSTNNAGHTENGDGTYDHFALFPLIISSGSIN